MRLINTRTLRLEEFSDYDRPKYAILSHTWANDEVNFQEWEVWQQGDPAQTFPIETKRGFRKIQNACRTARDLKFGFLWVDTNCIDKKSSAELSEAINSMFIWYRQSDVCLVHLEDFLDDPALGISPAAVSKCRWFTRGWTLQELLAPTEALFFNSGWKPIGNKRDLAPLLSISTGISRDIILDPRALDATCLAKRMSWASGRQTTRIEDMAYCLLGIFNIHMPLLYGEGQEAFRRLQEEIMKVSTDQSLFAWDLIPPPPNGIDGRGGGGRWISLLAAQPFDFISCRNSVVFQPPSSLGPRVQEYTLTNLGLSITLPLIPSYRPEIFYAPLNCGPEPLAFGVRKSMLAVPLRVVDSASALYTREMLLPVLSISSRYTAQQLSTICIPRSSEAREDRLAAPSPRPPPPLSPPAMTCLLQLFSINLVLKQWTVRAMVGGPKEHIRVPCHLMGERHGGRIWGCCTFLRNNTDLTVWSLVMLWSENRRWGHVCMDQGADDGRSSKQKSIIRRAFASAGDKPNAFTGAGTGMTVEFGYNIAVTNVYGILVLPLFFDVAAAT